MTGPVRVGGRGRYWKPSERTLAKTKKKKKKQNWQTNEQARHPYGQQDQLTRVVSFFEHFTVNEPSAPSRF